LHKNNPDPLVSLAKGEFIGRQKSNENLLDRTKIPACPGFRSGNFFRESGIKKQITAHFDSRRLFLRRRTQDYF
jgi:hypothetical protein